MTSGDASRTGNQLWVAVAMSLAISFCQAASASAQYGGGYGPGAQAPASLGGYHPGAMAPTALAPQFAPDAAQAAYAAYGPGAGYGGPPTCSPHGTPYCGEMDGYLAEVGAGGGGGFHMNKLITAHRYDDHWIDLRGEYIYFTRDDSNTSFPLTSDGVTGPIVLNSGDVELNDASGARLAAYIDVLHSFDLELSWMGDLRWSGSRQADGTANNLYSVFSDFGTTPPQGFVETDQATLHGLQYTSELNNFEMNARFRWIHTSRPWTGAWILGVRYLELDEQFRHFTFAQAHTDPIAGGPRGRGELNYLIDVSNDLVGFQFGGEFMASVLPGFMIGADFEAGIYGNSVKGDTTITANSIAGELLDERRKGQTAFIGEMNLTAVYRVFHEFYVRGGYQVLFIEGVSLAPDNFNDASPFVVPRPSTLRSDGNLTLQGVHFGVEWQW